MFEEIPIEHLVEDKYVSKETETFLKKIINHLVKKTSKKPKNEARREVGYTKLNYNDIKYDKDGWVDASRFAPARFDVVTLKTKLKVANGWFNGFDWYSRQFKNNPKVLYWKPTKENFAGGPKDVW